MNYLNYPTLHDTRIKIIKNETMVYDNRKIQHEPLVEYKTNNIIRIYEPIEFVRGTLIIQASLLVDVFNHRGERITTQIRPVYREVKMSREEFRNKDEKDFIEELKKANIDDICYVEFVEEDYVNNIHQAKLKRVVPRTIDTFQFNNYNGYYRTRNPRIDLDTIKIIGTNF